MQSDEVASHHIGVPSPRHGIKVGNRTVQGTDVVPVAVTGNYPSQHGRTASGTRIGTGRVGRAPSGAAGITGAGTGSGTNGKCRRGAAFRI